MQVRWGQFEKVEQPDRAYVRAYWRFLLGWGRKPEPPPDPAHAKALRRIAHEEVLSYRAYAATTNHRLITPFDDPPPTPPAAQKRAA
jgi:hypothetical protein